MSVALVKTVGSFTNHGAYLIEASPLARKGTKAPGGLSKTVSLRSVERRSSVSLRTRKGVPTPLWAHKTRCLTQEPVLMSSGVLQGCW